MDEKDFQEFEEEKKEITNEISLKDLQAQAKPTLHSLIHKDDPTTLEEIPDFDEDTLMAQLQQAAQEFAGPVELHEIQEPIVEANEEINSENIDEYPIETQDGAIEEEAVEEPIGEIDKEVAMDSSLSQNPDKDPKEDFSEDFSDDFSEDFSEDFGGITAEDMLDEDNIQPSNEPSEEKEEEIEENSEEEKEEDIEIPEPQERDVANNIAEKPEYSHWEELTDDNCVVKKYIFYISKDFIPYIDPLNADERSAYINDAIQKKIDVECENRIKENKKNILIHLVIMISVFVIFTPFVLLGVNKAIMMTFDNYKYSQDNFERLYKQRFQKNKAYTRSVEYNRTHVRKKD